MNPATVAQIALAVIEALLQLIPEEELRPLLDEAAAKRANAIADAAEQVKFSNRILP